MFGMLGTIAVVMQMAAMAFGYGVQVAMTIGLFACAAWLAHAIKQHDGWLFATNITVAGFAIWGIS
jgi:undecaprenyl pyrophosphate phosphatase UppP